MLHGHIALSCQHNLAATKVRMCDSERKWLLDLGRLLNKTAAQRNNALPNKSITDRFILKAQTRGWVSKWPFLMIDLDSFSG